jgi:hypothetical protein
MRIGVAMRAAIAAAGHGVQPLPSRLEHQQHRVADAELVHHAVERTLEEAVEVAATGHALRRAAQRRQAVELAARLHAARCHDLLDAVHRIQVGAAQPEHAGHAGVRRDAGELGFHALEERAFGLGAQVVRGDAVHRAVRRVDHQQLGHRVGEHVAPRLVEELERQREVACIDVFHLRDVGDIRSAVGRTGGHHARDRTFQAGPDGVEIEHVCGHVWLSGRAVPTALRPPGRGSARKPRRS